MNIIAAVDKNWAIGKNNELLVRIPMDQKFFRETTTGKVVVMGRKTLESFPNGLPLKNRTNIVLTHNPAYQVKDAIVVHSMEELHRELEKYDTNDVYVIGGQKIYEQLLDECMLHILQKSTMHMTRMRISRIWMKNRSGKLQQTVKNRHILIWNFISINMKECRSNE